jgi:dynein heavy chain 1
MRNLHVVFTMNPSANGLRDRASTSPALFNRCVLDWLGDWSLDAYYHVASELTQNVDMQKTDVILKPFFFFCKNKFNLFLVYCSENIISFNSKFTS